MGDIVLTQDDVVEKVDFPDGCVPSTWTIDLHYPKKQYAKKFADNPFISVAVHDRRIDRSYGYPVPYRCFYSRSINNLFMAGRCISVTHEALGTTRVMRTCGMMGEVVGKAASICVLKNCGPRGVYESHWHEMDRLLRLPGKARRKTVDGQIVVPPDALPLADAYGPTTSGKKGVPVNEIKGLVIDDVAAKKTGTWTKGNGLAGFIGASYLYGSEDATIRFDFELPQAGEFDIRIAYQPHANRGDRVPVVLEFGGAADEKTVNMREKAPLPNGFYSLGAVRGVKGQKGSVTLMAEGAGGYVHADAVQILAK